ncbi:diiron oxygenase [Streptomyces achromogenes]|uniref:diiron oxygenase n=1 Tax=Streptomyces achromogenes TaxID=67255 RepID=UPI0036F97499
MLLDDWYEKAGVRTQPARTFDPLLRGYLPFSPLAVPETDHPAVTALTPGARSRLLTHHLYRYLRYTVNLETRVVNRALTRLATDSLPMEVTWRTREDALKILTDESFHALVTMNMFRQVAVATEIEPVPYSFDTVLDRLDTPVANPTAGYDVVRHLMQACVFETMVTSILDQLPADPSVHPTVRELAADHAFDERYHHAFFARFFPELWTALDPATRLVAARDLPRLINACLEPDLATARAALADAGLGRDAAEDVVRDCYSPARVAAATRRTARHTIRLMRSTGVLDSPEGQDAFAEAGLLDLTETSDTPSLP